MPRRILKRYLPLMHRVKTHRQLEFLGERLHEPHLWHLNRHSVSRAVAIGLFCAYLPMPFEMAVAALLAILFRANLPISVLLVWISNPLTWVILYGPPYLLGAQLLGEPQVPLDHLTADWLKQNLAALWLGCVMFGAALAVAGYVLVQLLWRLQVRSSWEERKRRRVEAKAKRQAPPS